MLRRPVPDIMLPWGVLSVLLFLLVCTFTSCRERPGTINGTLYSECKFAAGDAAPIGQQLVAIPGIKVVAHGNGFNSAPCVTDLFGRFYFNDLPGGSYSVQWEGQNGWAAGTHPQRFKVNGQVQHSKPVMLVPEDGTAHFGHTALADGSAQYFGDEYFGINSTTMVSLTDATGANLLMAPAPVNAMGYFAVPGKWNVRSDRLVLTHEAQTTRSAFSQLTITAAGPAEVRQKNHKPLLLDLTPTVDGRTVRTAPGGAVLKVIATTKDADGHSLTHRWSAAPGSGTVTGTGSAIDWELPAGAGRYTLYAVVGDGHGGYDKQTLEFEAEKKTDLFVGKLLDKHTGNAIAGAQVSVAGVTTTSDAQGNFRITAPFQDRFVLAATKRGYAPLSKVLYSGLVGRTWRMVSSQESTVDPAQDFTITDTRPVLEKEKRRGARIQVPANSLVDKDGNKPTGALSAYIATINIADGESPGDWGAIGASGTETSLLSYGAAWVEFLDAAGNAYNLAPGKQAGVEMPAPDNMVATAPATAKLWSYSETDGYWRVSGAAQLKANKKIFSGTVGHFSYVNADIEKNDPACLRILLYPGIALGQTIRVSFPSGSPYSQSYDIEDCDSPLNAVYRLPANTDVVLTLIDGSGVPVPNIALEEQAGIILAGNVVNTGPPQGTDDWRVPEPYEACKFVAMRFLDVDVNASLFLTVNMKDINNPGPANNEAGTRAYYKGVDPLDQRTTLGAWWSKNGFTFDTADRSGPPNNATRTSYLNNNDLGSGRDMYFRKVDDDHIAAYVTNYGRFDQNTENARFAAERDSSQLGATVCMEYSPVENAADQNPIVKFFAYFTPDQTDHAAHARVNSADLDYFGQKYIPNLCVNCHGAEYYRPKDPLQPTFEDVDLSASFRELDYATYRFLNGDIAPTPDQRRDLKLQNNIVATAASGNRQPISSASIKELIAAWYTDGDDVQQTDWAPSSYVAAGPQAVQLYTVVVAKSCRTCHLALGDGITWSTYEELSVYSSYLQTIVLCDRERRMPHAAVTYRNFWLSTNPHGPAVLRDFSGPDWDTIGPCP